MASKRDIQLNELVGANARRAREQLLSDESSLTGVPPETFIETLISAYLLADDLPLEVARKWNRLDMGKALLDHMSDTADSTAAESCAWLLSQLPPRCLINELVIAARNEQLPVVARRWIATTIDRLAMDAAVEWSVVADLVESLCVDKASTLRVAASGIAGTLGEHPEACAVLVQLLNDSEISVIDSALQQLNSLKTVTITPRIHELMSHPNSGIAEQAARLVSL